MLICRFCGFFDTAVKAVQKFLADPDKRDAQAFKIEVEGVAASRCITKELFDHFVTIGDRNIGQLNKIARPWEPLAVFDEKTLLVCAIKLPEFYGPAKEVNLKFCSRTETVHSLGSHYTVITTHAAATSNATKIFL